MNEKTIEVRMYDFQTQLQGIHITDIHIFVLCDLDDDM